MTVRAVELVTEPENQKLLDEEQKLLDEEKKLAEANAAAALAAQKAKDRDFRDWRWLGDRYVKARYSKLKSKLIVELQTEDGKKFDAKIKFLVPEDAQLARRLAQEDQEKRQAELKAKKDATSAILQKKGIE